MSKLGLSVQPKKKEISLSKAKKRAWTVFSKYIRVRDALKTTGDPETAKCVTCGNTYPIKKMQGGHWIPGRRAAVLFSEQNVHAQCVICNLWRKGEYGKYTRAMKKMYGQEVMDELLDLDEQTVQIKAYQYLEIEETYKKKLKDLL